MIPFGPRYLSLLKCNSLGTRGRGGSAAPGGHMDIYHLVLAQFSRTAKGALTKHLVGALAQMVWIVWLESDLR
jgi:hypothetical protein